MGLTARLPENLPSIASARLPQSYENAKNALAECNKIDECQSWADKAEALASYARQAGDDALRKMADRIQARAVRRAGELLKQIEPGKTGPKPELREGDRPQLSRTQAATDAGMSEHQRKQALRVANVPEDDFERQTESDNPPTVTKLADMGVRKRDAEQAPKGFAQATKLIGSVRRFAEFCEAHEPEMVANGVMDQEVQELKQRVATIDSWLDRFVVNLG